MFIDVDEAAQVLKEQQCIVILTHKNPDGDTLGSAFGLYYILKMLGKTAVVLCSDAFAEKFDYLYEPQAAELPQNPFVLAVDVADEKLLGEKLEVYRGKIDMCIDHHISNRNYAAKTLLDTTAAANCEIMFQLGQRLVAKIPQKSADAFYTGIATDTGCFRYTNVTPATHRAAAELIELGACAGEINELVFETISEQKMLLEQMAVASLRFYFNKRFAVLTITREMLEKAGACEEDIEGIAAIPRRIAGVEVSAVLREQPEAAWKISLRSRKNVDVSAVANTLGGGGHRAAAGVRIRGTAEHAVETLKTEIAKALGCENE